MFTWFEAVLPWWSLYNPAYIKAVLPFSGEQNAN